MLRMESLAMELVILRFTLHFGYIWSKLISLRSYFSPSAACFLGEPAFLPSSSVSGACVII